MQIILIFSGNNITLPLSYHYEIQSLIYNILSFDRSYSAFIHNNGYTQSGKSFKLFTFGNLYGEYTVSSGKIIFKNSFMLQIRTRDALFAETIIKSAAVKKEYVLNNNHIMLTDFHVENKVFYETNVNIKTISPITAYETLENGHTLFYSPNEEAFYISIIRNAKNKFSSFFNNDSGEIKLLPLTDASLMKKTITKYKGYCINAWNGKFNLCCDPETLNFLYNTGLGAKNSQGFGMFEII